MPTRAQGVAPLTTLSELPVPGGIPATLAAIGDDTAPDRATFAINGLGVAPTGAAADFFRNQGMNYPPEFGPLAATAPGTPGALMTMVAEWGPSPSPRCLRPRSKGGDSQDQNLLQSSSTSSSSG